MSSIRLTLAACGAGYLVRGWQGALVALIAFSLLVDVLGFFLRPPQQSSAE